MGVRIWCGLVALHSAGQRLTVGSECGVPPDLREALVRIGPTASQASNFASTLYNLPLQGFLVSSSKSKDPGRGRLLLVGSAKAARLWLACPKKTFHHSYINPNLPPPSGMVRRGTDRQAAERIHHYLVPSSEVLPREPKLFS